MEEKKLFLAWQDPVNRSWTPIGILTVDKDGSYRFVYTKGAKTAKRFVPFRGMEDLGSVYSSLEMFPLFSNRMLSHSRPEYNRVLKWLDIDKIKTNNIIIEMLAMTEGIRATDSFEVFKCPLKSPQGRYEVNFFVHGLRYVDTSAIERLNNLEKGERLFLAHDIQNEFDDCAMALRTKDPFQFVGYCPRYLSRDFKKLLDKNFPSEVFVTVEKVNAEAPLNLRLLCKLITPWPQGFEPCSQSVYKPLFQTPTSNEEHCKLLNSTPGISDETTLSTSIGRYLKNNQSSLKIRPKCAVDLLSIEKAHQRGTKDRVSIKKKSLEPTENTVKQHRGRPNTSAVDNCKEVDLKATFSFGKSWSVKI